jgi:hypothetical protein
MQAAYLVILVATFLGVAALSGYVLNKLFAAQR